MHSFSSLCGRACNMQKWQGFSLSTHFIRFILCFAFNRFECLWRVEHKCRCADVFNSALNGFSLMLFEKVQITFNSNRRHLARTTLRTAHFPLLFLMNSCDCTPFCSLCEKWKVFACFHSFVLFLCSSQLCCFWQRLRLFNTFNC